MPIRYSRISNCCLTLTCICTIALLCNVAIKILLLSKKYTIGCSARNKIEIFGIKSTIYVITPTYERLTQRCDLTRLAQTLMLVPHLKWIVVEDAKSPTQKLSRFLKTFDLETIHLAAKQQRSPEGHRGVPQRNKGLEWMAKNVDEAGKNIVYFADDDNTYHIRIFEEMRNINKVGVWPMGFVAQKLAERPLLNKDGQIVDFVSWKSSERAFPIDMGAFAVDYSLVVKKNASFRPHAEGGYIETTFLEQLLNSTSELELICPDLGQPEEEIKEKLPVCGGILVWHTKTMEPDLDTERRLKGYSNRWIEV